MGFSVCVFLCVAVCVCGCVGVFAAVSVMAATPERIELENYRRSSTKVETELLEEPEEVSEETLNRFNLSLDDELHHRSESTQYGSSLPLGKDTLLLFFIPRL